MSVYLAVCAIVRNEALFLEEWLAFHRLTGVERFFIYENDSSDGTSELLAAQSDVVVRPWPHHPGQYAAYADMLERDRNHARWVAVIDADEFLFSPTGQPLADMLGDFERFPGVVANWRMFGTSDHERMPPEGTVRGFTRRAEDDYPPNRHVKSIVDPKRATGPFSPHAFLYYAGVRAVGEDRLPVFGPFRDPPTAELLRVNHYHPRSIEEARRKVDQPRADTGQRRPLHSLLDPAMNAVEDDRSILRTLDRTVARA